MLNKKLFSAFVVALLTTACMTNMNHHQPVMQKITGLKTPESVVQAKNGKIYVSEINGFGKDGDGQITVIEDGQPRVFATGLDDPKGLAIIGNTLYVADKTKMMSIDMEGAMSGKVHTFVPASAFPIAPLFLNDVEADLQGNLYVSDSGDLFGSGKGGAIYKVSPKGEVTLLINDVKDARVKAPNGLLADDTSTVLMYVDFASGVLYSLNTKTGALHDMAQGFGGGDGVVHSADGKMYVSDWKNGKVFSVNRRGDVSLVKEGYQSAADIALTKDERYIMVPDMKAGVLDFIKLK